MAAASSREPVPAQQPPGRTRAARSADEAWTQIQAICREAMATGRTIATIDRGIANRILDVRPNAVVRASDEARTPDGQGAAVMGLHRTELVVHVPCTLGDGAGYDVSSFCRTGRLTTSR
jgi:hypothetical protein